MTDPVAAALAWADLCKPDNPTVEVGRMTQDEIEGRCLDAIATLAAEVRRQADALVEAQSGREYWLLHSEDMLKLAQQAEAALAALKEQTCATCLHIGTVGEGYSWQNTEVCQKHDLMCSELGHRCGAWARREP